MPEPDSTSLSTYTLTERERTVTARCLTMAGAMLDALDEHDDARLVFELCERFEPGCLR